jgi:ornithine decarboxylase
LLLMGYNEPLHFSNKTALMIKSQIIRKLREWTWRFLPAEIIGTCSALLGAVTTYHATHSYALAAIAGSISETIGFYSYFAVRDGARYYARHSRRRRPRRIMLTMAHTLRDMMIEFGPAELLDSLFLRPFLMYWGSQAAANYAVGLIAGKLVADLAFYIMAAAGYEMKNKINTYNRSNMANKPSTQTVAALQVAAPKSAVKLTPYLTIDLAEIGKAYNNLRISLPEADIFYAVKANPDDDIIRHLHSLGSSFEIASATELDQLVQHGINAKDILFTNPVKMPEHIRRAHDAGVWRYSFDSIAELQKIAENAPGAAVFVRLAAPNFKSRVPSEGKFGIDAAAARALMNQAKKLGLQPYGMAFHVGTQMESPEPWEHAIAYAADLMRDLKTDGITIEMLDIGGAFPAFYGKKLPDITVYGQTISAALQKSLPYKVKVVCEPGRYLVAGSGIITATVIGVAERLGKNWVHLDIGAFNGLMEALESQNTLRFPVTDSRKSNKKTLYNVTGPTCDSQDTILFGVKMSKDLQVGDLVYIHSAGAYTTCYASTFNGFSIPKTYTV